jgi:putative glycosyltransferase (TIGR04372 family)
MKSLWEFSERHWEQIREGGWPELKSKLQHFLKRLKYIIILSLTFPLFIIPVAAIYMIRPWLLVRLGKLESEGIGHFSLPVEIYLSETDCGFHNPGQNVFDIWYLNKIVCNRVLEEKWRPFFRIWPRYVVKPIDNLIRFIPGGKVHQVPYRYIDDRSTPWQNIDIHNVLEETAPHLVFSADEEALGNRILQDMGIGENNPIVCFIVRDGAYFNEAHLKWNHRNASVHLLIPAMELLTELDYKAVRMGAKVNEALQTSNPSIIDYAGNGVRTELLDVFLISHSKFMVSTGTGLDALAPTFRRPLVHLNLAQFGFVDEMGKSVIFTPKHFWSISDKRMLTFSEIFKSGAHLFTLYAQYQKANIEPVDNTPDEICAVVSEMERRLSGTWENDPEDEVLQDCLRAIWPLRAESRPLQARIGTEFLRKHIGLLG